MADRIDARELARLLAATGRAHHGAFVKSDGHDPDWPIWYAAYLQAHIGDRLGSFASRAELAYLLVAAERAFADAGDGRGDWPVYYATYILDHFRGS